MKFIDLLLMSLKNLKRRKLRTTLTVLGVFIGTSAVVTMLGLGQGITDLQMKMIEQYGSIKSIEVQTNNDDSNSKKEVKYLDDKLIRTIKNMNNVQGISPVIEVPAILIQGGFTEYVTLQGVNEEYFKYVELKSGHYPTDKKSELQFIYGNMIKTGFYNQKTNVSYENASEHDKKSVDLEKKPVFVVFDTNSYNNASVTTTDSDNKVKVKKYVIPTAGFITGKDDVYNQYSFSVLTNIDPLAFQLKKVFGKRPIPGQPLTKKGKPFKEIKYNKLIVFVNDVKNISAIQKDINAMGYQATSNSEWIKQIKQSSVILQTFLGGVGAISLIVAAIGIANTMMMSIYERTKEIGIMKVLGCDMNRIRDMFLIESGCIGFLGGFLGLSLSLTLSLITSVTHVGQKLTSVDGNLIVISPIMAILAIIFAILIGMVSGLLPALRAMKLSPLSALRNE